MNIYLGNIDFDDIEENYGYKLNEEDRLLWNKYYNHKADLSGMEQCFHCFEIPKCIIVKGNDAFEAIKTIFTKDKLIKGI